MEGSLALGCKAGGCVTSAEGAANTILLSHQSKNFRLHEACPSSQSLRRSKPLSNRVDVHSYTETYLPGSLPL